MRRVQALQLRGGCGGRQSPPETVGRAASQARALAQRGARARGLAGQGAGALPGQRPVEGPVPGGPGAPEALGLEVHRGGLRLQGRLLLPESVPLGLQLQAHLLEL